MKKVFNEIKKCIIVYCEIDRLVTSKEVNSIDDLKEKIDEFENSL